MPFEAIFHKADALPFDGVSDDDGGLVRLDVRPIQSFMQLREVMTVDLYGMPVESFPFRAKRIQV